MSVWGRLLRQTEGAFLETRDRLVYRHGCPSSFAVVVKIDGVLDHAAVEDALVHIESCGVS